MADEKEQDNRRRSSQVNLRRGIPHTAEADLTSAETQAVKIVNGEQSESGPEPTTVFPVFDDDDNNYKSQPFFQLLPRIGLVQDVPRFGEALFAKLAALSSAGDEGPDNSARLQELFMLKQVLEWIEGGSKE